jgi:nucleoside-diphosphate-sugar epimerase
LLGTSAVDVLMDRVRPTHLLHLAWYTEHGAFWISPENLRWVEASLVLLRAFARVGGQRVVMAGSCAEYDWAGGVCSESTTPLQPRTLYGVCKDALRAVSAAYAASAGLSSSWGRVFFLYGPHERPGRLVSSVISALLAGRTAECSHGNQIRDFLHAEDVASALVAILDSTAEGAVNVASGLPVSIRDLVNTIADRIGAQELVRFGVAKTNPDDPAVLVADTQRLRSEVGWSPRYTLDQGVERTIAWWRDHIASEPRS